MNKNLKKIIAREGLVIIFLILLFLLSFFLPADITHGFLASRVMGIAICGYPTYLIIRFIIWAIKALREK